MNEALAGSVRGALRRVPTLIVQHMPPVFTAVFAEHIAARVGLPAAEGKMDERLEPARIYVAPGAATWASPRRPCGPVISSTTGRR